MFQYQGIVAFKAYFLALPSNWLKRKKVSVFCHLATIIIANRIELELTNSLPSFTVKGWAKVNVAYSTQIFINVVENMVVVKSGSTSKFTCLVLIVSIILCNIYVKEKSKSHKKNEKMKWKREK